MHKEARMGIFDKAKDVLGEHMDKVDEGVEKVGEYADERTGNKYTERIDEGEKLADKELGDYLNPDKPPAAPPTAEKPA
jgi:hypothetical protein